jgi:hypothetical protein
MGCFVKSEDQTVISQHYGGGRVYYSKAKGLFRKCSGWRGIGEDQPSYHNPAVWIRSSLNPNRYTLSAIGSPIDGLDVIKRDLNPTTRLKIYGSDWILLNRYAYLIWPVHHATTVKQGFSPHWLDTDGGARSSATAPWPQKRHPQSGDQIVPRNEQNKIHAYKNSIGGDLPDGAAWRALPLARSGPTVDV